MAATWVLGLALLTPAGARAADPSVNRPDAEMLLDLDLLLDPELMPRRPLLERLRLLESLRLLENLRVLEGAPETQPPRPGDRRREAK